MAIIEAKNITKIYSLGGEQVRALDDLTLSIESGEFVAVMGPSGSGKSTFMNIIGCLDKPTSGDYVLDGTNVANLSRDELAGVRNKKIGFIFQGFNLLPRTTAIENCELPMLYGGISAEERRKRAAEALTSVGLKERLNHMPNQLSGGQQQRVAIARALVNGTPIILADEPTGNLDSRTSVEIMDLLVQLNARSSITIILVTHEHDIAAFAKRTIHFKDGKVIKDAANSK